ncbi:MAG: hypothetical protein M1832_000712 [Thelocarpon impressellum]|nr:MAG: hypothetical protein M1832_000712 [Thelocarpon impressellum]
MATQQLSDGPKVKLYWLEKSRSQRILWLLEELKVPYDIQTFKRTKEKLAPPELKEIHPLGKSPVVSIEAPGLSEPLILAESSCIIEYLTEHFGKWLEPKQYAEGKEGQVGGETEEWLRYRFFMHYAEGSLMTYLIVALIVGNIKSSPVPFFIKPITGAIANKINSLFLEPNFTTHFSFLEGQIASSPGGGDYLCGKELTGADILMSFPLEAAKGRTGLDTAKYPKLCAYIDRLHEREAYKNAVKKIIEVEGSYDSNL